MINILKFQINPVEIRYIEFVKPKHATKRKGGVSEQSDTEVKRSKTSIKWIPSE